MKHLFITIIAIVAVPSLALAEQITVTVNGMVCSFCAQGIKKSFLKLEQVKNVSVDLEAKKVEIETKDDAKLPDDAIKTVITDAGYESVNIERK